MLVNVVNVYRMIRDDCNHRDFSGGGGSQSRNHFGIFLAVCFYVFILSLGYGYGAYAASWKRVVESMRRVFDLDLLGR